MTTVSERTMNSIPSVVMKLGMANVRVMKPFRNPIAPAMASPKKDGDRRRRSRGDHAMIMSDVAIGVSAKVEPTALPSIGDGLELQAVATAVIGGTALTGGVGTVLGAIVGTPLIRVIENGWS